MQNKLQTKNKAITVPHSLSNKKQEKTNRNNNAIHFPIAANKKLIQFKSLFLLHKQNNRNRLEMATLMNNNLCSD